MTISLRVGMQRVLLIVDRLERLIDDERPDFNAVAEARWNMARHTLRFMDETELHLFGRAFASGDDHAIATAEHLWQRRDALARSFQDHAQRYWSEDTIRADPAGYCNSLRPNLDELREVIADEERLLCPLLRDLPPLADEPPAPRREWQKEAWRYRSGSPKPNAPRLRPDDA